MEEKYKNWIIKYEEAKETFVATDSAKNTLNSQRLKELKKKIDKFSFKRTPVLYKHFYKDDILIGEITSVVDDERFRPEVWVSYVEKDGAKSRTKKGIDSLYKQTDNNMKIYKEINKTIGEKDKLEEKIEKLTRQLEKIVKEDLGIVAEGVDK